MRRLSTLAAWVLPLAVSGAGAQRASPPNELTSAERTAGWRLLFDGKTFAGWRGLHEVRARVIHVAAGVNDRASLPKECHNAAVQ